MKTIKQAFSQANTAAGDEGMNTTGLAWYIDAAQYILNDIARACFAWQKERWFYVAHDGPDAVPSLAAVSVGAYDYPSNDLMTIPDYVVHSFPVQPAAATTVQILPQVNTQRQIFLPAADSGRMILRVTRNQFECKEFPYASVQSNIDFNRPFPNNDTTLSDLAYGTRVTGDGSIELLFAMPMLPGETFYVCYTTQEPVSFSTVTASDSVPDWVFPALEEGIKFKIMEKFFYRGSDSHKPRMDAALNRYEKLKYDAVQYSRNLIDKRSTLVLQPMKWLPDTQSQFY